MTDISRELADEYLRRPAERKTRRARGPRVKGEARDELIQDIVASYPRESVRAIAARTGRSYGFVHKVLEEHGAQFKARGGANRAHLRRLLMKWTRLKHARIYPPVGLLHGLKGGTPVLKGQASWRTVSGVYWNTERFGFVSVEVRNHM